MLVLALEFSRIRAARVDRFSQTSPDRDTHRASGGVATSPEAARPLPQNGRARSGSRAPSPEDLAGVRSKLRTAAEVVDDQKARAD